MTDVCLVLSDLRALLASLLIPCLTPSIEQLRCTQDQADYENVLRSLTTPIVFHLKRPIDSAESPQFCEPQIWFQDGQVSLR